MRTKHAPLDFGSFLYTGIYVLITVKYLFPPRSFTLFPWGSVTYDVSVSRYVIKRVLLVECERPCGLVDVVFRCTQQIDVNNKINS